MPPQVHLLSRHTGHSEDEIAKDIARPKYFNPYEAGEHACSRCVWRAASGACTRVLVGRRRWCALHARQLAALSFSVRTFNTSRPCCSGVWHHRPSAGAGGGGCAQRGARLAAAKLVKALYDGAAAAYVTFPLAARGWVEEVLGVEREINLHGCLGRCMAGVSWQSEFATCSAPGSSFGASISFTRSMCA